MRNNVHAVSLTMAEQRNTYDMSLLNYRDWKKIWETALEKAVEKRTEAIATKSILASLINDVIEMMTRLYLDNIVKLRFKHNP